MRIPGPSPPPMAFHCLTKAGSGGGGEIETSALLYRHHTPTALPSDLGLALPEP